MITMNKNRRQQSLYYGTRSLTITRSSPTNKQQVSAVADGPCNADLCTLKSYNKLFHETKLPQTECVMFVLQSTDLYHRPSKLYAVCILH